MLVGGSLSLGKHGDKNRVTGDFTPPVSLGISKLTDTCGIRESLTGGSVDGYGMQMQDHLAGKKGDSTFDLVTVHDE